MTPHELVLVAVGVGCGLFVAAAYFVANFFRELRVLRRRRCHCGRPPHAVVTVQRLGDGSVFSQATVCRPCHGWYAAHDAENAPPWRDV